MTVRKFPALVILASCLMAGGPALSQDEDTPETQVTEEIVIEGRRTFNRRMKPGFDAFQAGDFKQARIHFRSLRHNEFRVNADAFTNYLEMSTPLTGEMSHITFDARTSDPYRRQAYAIMYYMEGMSNLGLGKLKDASRAFWQALEMNPSHFDARADYVLTQISLGKRKKAEKNLKRLKKDLEKCDVGDEPETCTAISDRLTQVEDAYARVIIG